MESLILITLITLPILVSAHLGLKSTRVVVSHVNQCKKVGVRTNKKIIYLAILMTVMISTVACIGINLILNLFH